MGKKIDAIAGLSGLDMKVLDLLAKHLVATDYKRGLQQKLLYKNLYTEGFKSRADIDASLKKLSGDSVSWDQEVNNLLILDEINKEHKGDAKARKDAIAKVLVIERPSEWNDGMIVKDKIVLVSQIGDEKSKESYIYMRKFPFGAYYGTKYWFLTPRSIADLLEDKKLKKGAKK